VSVKKLTPEALELEKFLIDALLNTLPDQVYFKDLKSRFIRVNKALASRFGVTDPSEVTGKTDFDFFSLEHAQQAFDDEQSIIKTGQKISKIEKETRHDHTDRWVSTMKLPLSDSNGNIIGTFGISRDITETKESEDALAKEQYLMHLLMDNLPDHIYFKDTASCFLRVNEALAKSLGLDKPE
jgi:PAS domain S-box-containing protein